jgi:hypothetical protein
MALKKSHSTTFGLELQEAYFKISSVSGSKLGARIAVDFYVDEAASKSGKSPVGTSVFDFAPSASSKNWDAQAYEHLKTLPEFAGATDC